MSFTNRELYMVLGAVVFVALVAAILAPRELKEAASPPAAAASAAVTQGAASSPSPALRTSANGRYSSATWARAPRPAPNDPTPY